MISFDDTSTATTCVSYYEGTATTLGNFVTQTMKDVMLDLRQQMRDADAQARVQSGWWLPPLIHSRKPPVLFFRPRLREQKFRWERTVMSARQRYQQKRKSWV